MTFKAPERAAVLKPVDAEEEDFLCLVMPLRLQE